MVEDSLIGVQLHMKSLSATPMKPYHHLPTSGHQPKCLPDESQLIIEKKLWMKCSIKGLLKIVEAHGWHQILILCSHACKIGVPMHSLMKCKTVYWIPPYYFLLLSSQVLLSHFNVLWTKLCGDFICDHLHRWSPKGGLSKFQHLYIQGSGRASFQHLMQRC